MRLEVGIPEQVREILDRVEKTGREIYIVGGVVRDAILGKQL